MSIADDVDWFLASLKMALSIINCSYGEGYFQSDGSLVDGEGFEHIVEDAHEAVGLVEEQVVGVILGAVAEILQLLLLGDAVAAEQHPDLGTIGVCLVSLVVGV